MTYKEMEKLSVVQRVFGKHGEYFDDVRFPWKEKPCPKNDNRHRHYEKRVAGDTYFRRVENKEPEGVTDENWVKKYHYACGEKE